MACLSNLPRHSNPHGTSNNFPVDILNLPPDCAPYVLVLTEVPSLQVNIAEPYDALYNKVCWWLATFTKGLICPAKDVIMVRRVSWIGNSHKRFKGDCVVVNFNNKFSSNYVLSSFHARLGDSAGIFPLPLCFFYQQPISLMTISNLSSRQLCSSSSFLPLYNRFYPLADINSND